MSNTLSSPSKEDVLPDATREDARLRILPGSSATVPFQSESLKIHNVRLYLLVDEYCCNELRLKNTIITSAKIIAGKKITIKLHACLC